MSPGQIARKAGNITDSVAENSLFKLVGRGAMVVAIPLFMYMSDRTEKSLDTRFEAVKEQIIDRTSDRYTGTQAASDWASNNQRWTIQSSRDDRQDRDRERIERQIADRLAAFDRWLERYLPLGG
jgi:hypothetical protein